MALAERTSGADHPDTLTAVKNLADAYQDQDRHDEAEALFGGRWREGSGCSAPSIPTRWSASTILRSFYQSRERFGEAEPLFKRALAARERVLGAEHPDTLQSVENLARLYAALAHDAEAEPLFARALEAQTRVLAPDAPDTMATVEDLAQFYQARQRFSEAEPLLRRDLDSKERTLGPDHPDTLLAAGALASGYLSERRFGDAEPLFEARGGHSRTHARPRRREGASGRWRAGGPLPRAGPVSRRRTALSAPAGDLGTPRRQGRSATLASLDDLAGTYRALGRYGEAEPLYLRLLDARERLLGKDDAGTLAADDELAGLYSTQGRYAAAEPLYRHVVEVKERVLGKEHLETLKSLNNLVQLLLRERRDNEAEPLMTRALEAEERLQGTDHPDTLVWVSNLAALYSLQGRYDEAEPLYRRVLDTSERVRGPDSPDTITSASNMAFVYIEQGRYGEAEPLLKRALEANERVFGKDHPYTLINVSNLAGLYQILHRYGEAEALDRRALETAERVFGGDHPQTFLSLNNLGRLYSVQGRYDEAEPLYRQALDVSGRVLGADHPQTLVSVGNLAELYFARRDWSRAAQFWRRSTAAIIARTRRGGETDHGLTGRKQSEAEQASEQFGLLVKALHRLPPAVQGSNRAAAFESFQTAQWALSSEAARSLALMAARGAKGDPKLASLARERQDLVAEWQARDALRNAALGETADKRDPKAEAENRDRLAAIDQRIAEIDKILLADYPDYAALASPEPLSVEELRKHLGANEALVLFLSTPEEQPAPEETFVWVVTKTAMRWVRSGLGKAALTREVQALRCGLDEEEWATPTSAARCGDLLALSELPDASRPLPFHLGKAYALYKALFGQVEDTIAGKRLLIVPSGALTSLPFHALVTKAPKAALPDTFAGYRNVEWLGRRNAIIVLPSVSSVKALRQHASDTRRRGGEAYAGYGDPALKGDGALVPLGREPCGLPIRRWRHEGNADLSIPRRFAAARAGEAATPPSMIFSPMAARRAPCWRRCEAFVRCPIPPMKSNASPSASKPSAPLIRLEGAATEADIKSLSRSGQLARYRILHFATHGLLSGDVERMAKRQGEPALVLTPPLHPGRSGR